MMTDMCAYAISTYLATCVRRPGLSIVSSIVKLAEFQFYLEIPRE